MRNQNAGRPTRMRRKPAARHYPSSQDIVAQKRQNLEKWSSQHLVADAASGLDKSRLERSRGNLSIPALSYSNQAAPFCTRTASAISSRIGTMFPRPGRKNAERTAPPVRQPTKQRAVFRGFADETVVQQPWTGGERGESFEHTHTHTHTHPKQKFRVFKLPELPASYKAVELLEGAVASRLQGFLVDLEGYREVTSGRTFCFNMFQQSVKSRLRVLPSCLFVSPSFGFSTRIDPIPPWHS